MTNYTELKRLAEAAKACAHLSYYTSHDGMGMMFAYADALAKCRATQADGWV